MDLIAVVLSPGRSSERCEDLRVALELIAVKDERRFKPLIEVKPHFF